MDPFLQDKIADLIVTVIGVLIGGGLIVAFVEWKRHQREQEQWKREQEQWKREQEKLEIDVPRAEIATNRWEVTKAMDDKMKLIIFENELSGKVSSYLILVDFVVRNTTNGEVIVTSYGVDDPTPPATRSKYDLHDMVKSEMVDKDNLSASKLPPLGTIARTALMQRKFAANKKIDNPPEKITIYAETSDGKRILQEVTLKETSIYPSIRYNDGMVPFLKSYIDTLSDEDKEKLGFSVSDISEEEIPF